MKYITIDQCGEDELRSSLKRKRPQELNMDSESTPKVCKVDNDATRKNRMSGDLRTDTPSSVNKVEVPSPEKLPPNTNPDAYIKLIIKSYSGRSIKSLPALSLMNFFLEPTEEHLASYTSEVLTAVQEEDIDAIKILMKEGHSFQCCNRFGESVLHMACRRGLKKVVKFLINEANISVRVKDDYGRTPMHDACWCKDPQFEIIELLLQQEPRLLFVTDKRGFTPFSYSRMEHWIEWNQFIHRNRKLFSRTEELKLTPPTVN